MYIIPEFNNQQPNPLNLKIETYKGRIKTLRDALLVLEGTRLGYLPKVKRRLNGLEREFIKPNTIFAWNETECGMKRWTDGKNWSASKVSGPFLTYRELDSDKSTVKKNGLTKQSFSLTTKQGQKFHLISYYADDSNKDGDKDSKAAEITSPSSDPLLKDLKLNANIYQEYLLYYDQYLNYENDASMSIYHPYSVFNTQPVSTVAPVALVAPPMHQLSPISQPSPYQVSHQVGPQQLSHMAPQVSSLQQPYPALASECIPTQPYQQMSRSAPTSIAVPMPAPSHVMVSPQSYNQESSQVSPQLSEGSITSLPTPIQQPAPAPSQAHLGPKQIPTTKAKDPARNYHQASYTTTMPAPFPPGNRMNPPTAHATPQTQPQFQLPMYGGGGYFQYPVSYYYPSSNHMEPQRPIDRIENFSRDNRTTALSNTGGQTAFTNERFDRTDQFTMNTNNSNSSVSTSPTTTREGDTQTLKMLDKGFSS